MEFKISEKSKNNWENLMNELGIESQMTEEALIAKKIKEFSEAVRKEKEHLEHLKKYHFNFSPFTGFCVYLGTYA